ncbi:MAG TPA: hypothetical protein IAB59_04350 [Candidatus Onthousia faecipullorum]|uniref:Uncharacterized protein n=1 Tax=Candidatus Onthousia faecipullorum TaxID=2840887 RepID=A0A9D1KAW3_9FIRM|nr:hypothetical protein [Candidatus Onthousia faecipullorum]
MSVIENEESIKNSLLTKMNKASTIEELLDLKWQFTKIFYTRYYNIKLKTFYKNIERIAYVNALRNINNIVDDLINKTSIEDIKDKYNTSFNSIKKMIDIYSRSGTYQNKELNAINNIENIDLADSHDLDFLCAKTAVGLFIDNNVYNIVDAYNKTHVSKDDYYLYLNLLNDKNHPLHKQYYNIITNKRTTSWLKSFEKKKVEKINTNIDNIRNCSNKELFAILSSANSSKINYFTTYYNLNSIIFSSILKMNKHLAYEFANNRENTWYIYNYYVDLYRQVSKEVIRDIRLLSRDKFKQPLDLYKYYSNNYDLYYISKIAKELPDLKNSSLISKYIEKFSSLFQYLDEKTIHNIKLSGHFYCLRESITFTNNDFNNAIMDIEMKGMPLYKGVLYESLKRQIGFKNNKVKKKSIY